MSKAKAEIERLKSNKKITKKGKKNRLELLRECKTLSVAVLVAYNGEAEVAAKKSKTRLLEKEEARRCKKNECSV